MLKRGYIVYYSESEEEEQTKWAFEKYKEMIKKERKTVSILVDSVVGDRWCSITTREYLKNNFSMDREKFTNILRAINNEKLASEVSIWFNVVDRIDEWLWISKRRR